MAKILGLGGVFFKSNDPAKLTKWYSKWLGLESDDQGYVSLNPSTMPEGGYTVWGPFKNSTTYFSPSEKEYMFNLVVDKLDEALDQAKQGGAEIVGEIEEYDFGRFGWFMDPEANKVELWEPKKC